jgi:hypothetical protein
MCDKCQQLETKIQRYRKFVVQGFDKLTIDRINSLIQQLEQEKQALH